MKVKVSTGASQQLAEGFRDIRRQFLVPGEFPPNVLAAADAAARRPIDLSGRVDVRHLDFQTLDPATSTDLDQAYYVEQSGDDVTLHYAIADVGFFVDRGSELEAEAWKRGATIYAPDGRVPQYPEVLCEGAASLLPDVDRPAVVLTVEVRPDGISLLRSAQRAVIRSRSKLAYESTSPEDLGPAVAELHRRIELGESARGANRIEFPEQTVDADPSAPGGLRLGPRHLLPSEELNAAMSLAANLAVAQRMIDAREGLFRVMPDPAPHVERVLHRTASALGVEWPKGITLRQLFARLDTDNPQHVAFARTAQRVVGERATPPSTRIIGRGTARSLPRTPMQLPRCDAWRIVTCWTWLPISNVVCCRMRPRLT